MFRKIVLWFSGLLIFSFAAYVATSIFLAPRNPAREELMRRVSYYQLAEAIRAYESGGKAGAAELLQRLDRSFPAKHYLVDQNGKDLVTGQDWSEQIAKEAGPGRHRIPGRRPRLIRRSLPGSQYALLIEMDGNRPDPLANIAVYGWIVLVIVLLCYVLARTLVTPVRELRESVVRFGQGDLASRTHSRRRDELGDLARAFDEMADRIQTLLTAERRLLQDVSHELRSPLARLRFAVELAKSSRDPEAAFARVNKEIERLSSLVGELLQVTRAEGDPEARNIGPINLAELVESIVQDCRIEAEAKGCTIDVFVQERAVWSGDRELLHRALENVLRNAIHYTPEGTAIEVDLRMEGGHIFFRVRDYGPGVPSQDLSQIFRPFYRVEEDRSRQNGGGVGLGLAIVERAVRLHGGQASAHNMDPGLLVELRLPR